MNTILHLHTENSVKECALKVVSVVNRAKELGYMNAALADHGNMTGIMEFYRAALSEGINPILGVECNIMLRHDIEDTARLVLFAKDQEGYRALCKIVSKGNCLLDGKALPVVEWDEFLDFFRKDSLAEHVVVLTGGRSGLCSYLLRQGSRIREKIRQMELSAGPSPGYDFDKRQGRLDDLKEELRQLAGRRDELKKESSRVFTKRIQKAERLRESGDMDGYRKMAEEIDQERALAQNAADELKAVQKKITAWRKLAKDMEKEIKKAKDRQEEWDQFQTKIQKMKRCIEEDAEDLKQLKEYLKVLRKIFKNNLFMELVFHRTEPEGRILPILIQTAREMDIQCVLSNEPYMLQESEKEIYRMHLIRSLAGNQWVPVCEGDDAAGMLAEDELCERMGEFLTKEELQMARDNTDWIGEVCRFRFDEDTDHYPRYRVQEGETAPHVLEMLARKAIPVLFADGAWTQEYEERLRYEIEVITGTGYSDYTLNVKKILDRAREKEKRQGYMGCTIGPGRGSGAGSLVNYLLGITHVDPIRYELIFERYLNVERISPPDIDSDIATSIRDSLVQGIKEDYSTVPGKIGVCSIMTKLTLAARASIRAAGRIISSKLYGNTTALFELYDAMSKMIPAQPHIRIADAEEMIMDSFGSKKEALQILEAAKLIEGVVQGYGTHAAGVIISDNGDVTDYAPLMNVGTNEEPVWNIQCDMGESERLGLLKMDMLGLTTLDVIDQTIELVYQNRGERIDIHHLPFEEEVFRNIYSAGNTACVFQCESAGMRKMWKELGPDCIEDIIAGIALYRPGPMDFIPAYIQGKHHPEKIRYKTQLLKPILNKTYGCIVYQEQVMRIVRDLAGFSMGRSDLVRRAMSKKKADILKKERKNFVYGNRSEYENGRDAQYIPGCVANGIPAKIADSIYDDMIDFAKYAFNKSHAAAYALVSYQTAWLKYHYPIEFMCASLNLARPEKYPDMVAECRQMGIRVRKPDINTSSKLFSIRGENTILYGIGKIKNVKKDAARIIEKRSPLFESISDFLIRTEGISKTSIEYLVRGGAFDRFCKSRKAVLDKLPRLKEKAAKIQEMEVKKQLNEELLRKEDISQKKRVAAFEKIKGLEGRIKQARQEMEEIESGINTEKDKYIDNHEYEKDALYAFVESNPIDLYERLIPKDHERISDAVQTFLEGCRTESKAVLYGVVKDLKETKRKTDGKHITVFLLEDRSGSIRILTSEKSLGNEKRFLKEGCAIKVEGSLQKDRKEADQAILFADSIKALEMDVKQVLFFPGHAEWKRELEPFLVSQGHRLVLYDSVNGVFEDTGYFLSDDVWNSSVSERMCEVRERLGLIR